jgi:hypothetical protein
MREDQLNERRSIKEDQVEAREALIVVVVDRM